MDTVAILLAHLRESRRPFVVGVMDGIFEEIVRGCEHNDFKEAQKRVAVMKFVGECFNFKVLSTRTLFDLLYKLINYDYESHATDAYMQQLDSAQDSFRIRLVCTTLDSLGRYFQRGERRLQMDRFLMFFQRYIFSKNYVLMDLEFMILDTFDSVRPKFIRFQSQTEAELTCQQIEDLEQKNCNIMEVIRAYHEEDQSSEDYYRDQYYDDEEEEDDIEEEEDEAYQEKIREEIKAQRQQMAAEQEELEGKAFDLEFNSLVQESAVTARKENPLAQPRKEILIPVAQIKKQT